MVLDAKRIADHIPVCIKMIRGRNSANEVDIARYLSHEEHLGDMKNHSVPIFDSFQDPFLPEVKYLVMPLLRPYDDPEFWAIGEVVDFATQILEVSGLSFFVKACSRLSVKGCSLHAQSWRGSPVCMGFGMLIHPHADDLAPSFNQ